MSLLVRRFNSNSTLLSALRSTTTNSIVHRMNIHSLSSSSSSSSSLLSSRTKSISSLSSSSSSSSSSSLSSSLLLSSNVSSQSSSLLSYHSLVSNQCYTRRSFTSVLNVHIHQQEDMSPWKIKLGLFFFTFIGITTFSLGVWQLQRRQWKMDLIQKLKQTIQAEPIAIDQALHMESIQDHEFQRVKVEGTLLYDKTMLLGPRLSPKEDVGSTGGMGARTDTGYFVITPLQTKEGHIVLVNRGWIPTRDKEHLPKETTSSSTFSAIAVIRPTEIIPSMVNSAYDNRKNAFLFMSVPEMIQHAQIESPLASTVFFDVLEPSDPVLQRKSLTNMIQGGRLSTTPTTHAAYAITWFCLSACMTGLIFFRFRQYYPQLRRTAAAAAALNQSTPSH